jgi:hypothetical protein
MGVIVKPPGSNGFWRDVEDVGPALARQNLVAAVAVARLDAERPRAIGVDPVMQPVQVEAVAIVPVPVKDVQVEPLASTSI